MDAKEENIIWLDYENRIPDCCWNCENIMRFENFGGVDLENAIK
jgi:hypothetical protein